MIDFLTARAADPTTRLSLRPDYPDNHPNNHPVTGLPTGNLVDVSSELSFYLHDHLGNTRVTFRADGPAAIAIDYAADFYPYGKILREYKICEADRYLSTHHERDKSTGYDNRGARLYDSEIGRFLGVDPLANHPNQIHVSPYHYAANNPVLHNDPDGKCPPWICGAIAGAIFEAGTQVVVGMATGQSFTEAVQSIDLVDVGAAALEGGLTGGASVVRRAAASATKKVVTKGLTILASEAVQASADVTVDGKVDIVGTEGSTKTASTVIINTVAGTIAGGAGEATGAALNAATRGTTDQLAKAKKKLERKQAGSEGDRLARKNISRLTRTAAANSAMEQVSAATVTETIKEKTKVER
jgi:RHS repeat-associated protein